MNTAAPFSVLHARPGLTLELIDERHAGALFDLVEENRKHLGEWLPWVPHMQTVEDFRRYVQQCKQQHRDGTDYGFVLVFEQQIVGRIGIHNLQGQNKCGAIGYWLGQSYEGKGLVTAACSALCDACFSQLQLNRIEIRCGTGNRKSAAVPERLRFSKEGVLRQAEFVNGSFIDLALYSMLREEWQQRR